MVKLFLLKPFPSTWQLNHTKFGVMNLPEFGPMSFQLVTIYE